MADYKKMYSKLVVAMSNSIESMQKALQEAEEIYISDEVSEQNSCRILNLEEIKKDGENPK